MSNETSTKKKAEFSKNTLDRMVDRKVVQSYSNFLFCCLSFLLFQGGDTYDNASSEYRR